MSKHQASIIMDQLVDRVEDVMPRPRPGFVAKLAQCFIDFLKIFWILPSMGFWFSVAVVNLVSPTNDLFNIMVWGSVAIVSAGMSVGLLMRSKACIELWATCAFVSAAHLFYLEFSIEKHAEPFFLWGIMHAFAANQCILILIKELQWLA